MCVWLPNWPLQRIRLQRPEPSPRAIVLHAETTRGGRRVVLCSREALQLGIRPGMPLAEAQALPLRDVHRSNGRHRPKPCFEPWDPRADRQSLRKLTRLCRRFAPLVGLEEAETPECLLLDVSGCAPLFGGERNLAQQLAAAFRQRGLSVRVAVAGTIGTAWAVAHFGRSSHRADSIPATTRHKKTGTRGNNASNKSGRSERAPYGASDALSAARHDCGGRFDDGSLGIVPAGEERQTLRPLPIEALRLSPSTVEKLHALGIRRIGTLLDLPRSLLPSRFSSEVVQRLGEALGEVEETITAERPSRPLMVRRRLEIPTADRRTIEAVLQRLLGRLVRRVRSRGEGVRRLLCRLEPADGSAVRLKVELVRPCLQERHLFELLRLRLERLLLPGEAAELRLRAESAPLEVRPRTLFDDGFSAKDDRELARFVDRLSQRLGEQAVLCAIPVPEIEPERTCRYEPVVRRGFSHHRSRTSPPEDRAEDRDRSHSPGGEQYEGARRSRASLGERRRVTALGSSSGRFHPVWLLPKPVRVEGMAIAPDGFPVRFRWNRQEFRIAGHWGPERIETGWWRGPAVRRDYYRVETTQGRRFWLFRCRKTGRWFLHGAF